MFIGAVIKRLREEEQLPEVELSYANNTLYIRTVNSISLKKFQVKRTSKKFDLIVLRVFPRLAAMCVC